jgi:hypothetical protein
LTELVAGALPLDPTPAMPDPELQKLVFVSEIGNAPASAADDLRSFFLAVHRCCARWMELNPDASDAGASAFVLSERLELDPVYDARMGEFALKGRLDQAPPKVIPGPILLVSRNLRLCHARACADGRVKGIVDDLKLLELDARPTAIFIPGERALLIYWNGVSNQMTLSANPALLKGLNIADLKSTIDRYHEVYTRFPDGLGNCWHSATDRVVNKNAEAAIRNTLFIFLGLVVFRTDYVIREHQLPNGRVDIFIWGVALGSMHDHRVIELKVLRSRPSTWHKDKPNRPHSRDSVKKYCERGVRQAARYKAMTAASEAHLVCFDAQLENEDMGIDAYAVTQGVIHRRLYMESSTKVL